MASKAYGGKYHMNKAMIFGAGKIARGFLGQLLFLSNFEEFIKDFELKFN